jgi:tetratricopeptide (TPR) repeat protein
MQSLRQLNDLDINAILDTAENLAENLGRMETEERFIREDFFTEVSAMCRAVLYDRTYNNGFDGEMADLMKRLYDMIAKNIRLNQNSIVLIPITLELMQANQSAYRELTDYLAEGIALDAAEKKGIKIESYEYHYDGFDLDELYAQVSLSEEYADREDFENAVSCLNRVIDILENILKNETISPVIDLAAVLNNKAYYLFRLNRLNEALEVIFSTLNLNSSKAIYHYTYAEILDALGDFDKALDAIDEAIRLEDSPDKRAFKKSILAKIEH